MEENTWQLMMPDIAFYRTSTRPIPLKLVPNPLGIINTACQIHNNASYPPLKATRMMTTNFSQFPGLGSSSHVDMQSHILRFSALMPGGPLTQCSNSRSTASEISSLVGILLSTGKGATSMGIGLPGGGTWAYRSARSAIKVSRDKRAGGGGLLATFMCHPRIRTHVSLTRGIYDSRRDSIVQPNSSACLFRSILRPAQIHCLSCRTVHWSPYRRAVTLAPMAEHVSSEI